MKVAEPKPSVASSPFNCPAAISAEPDGSVAFDPDEQVQATIRLVFALFERLGSVSGVLRYLVNHDIRSARQGVLHREKTPFTWVPLPGSAEEQSDVPSAGDNGLRPGSLDPGRP